MTYTGYTVKPIKLNQTPCLHSFFRNQHLHIRKAVKQYIDFQIDEQNPTQQSKEKK